MQAQNNFIFLRRHKIFLFLRRHKIFSFLRRREIFLLLRRDKIFLVIFRRECAKKVANYKAVHDSRLKNICKLERVARK